MNSELHNPQGCSEKYAELCALSTTGELSAEEFVDLDAHLAACPQCSELLDEYTSLAHGGMAMLAAEFAPDVQTVDTRREKKAEQRLKATLRSRNLAVSPTMQRSTFVPSPTTHNGRKRRLAFALGTAAALLVCVGGAFELGRKVELRMHRPEVIAATRPPAVDAGVAESLQIQTQERLAAARAGLDESMARSAEAEKQVAELSRTKASLLAQIDELTKRDQATAASLVAATQQRDALQQQLADTSKSLEQVKEDLNQVQQARQGEVLRIASLEQEVNSLHATVTVTDGSASNDEQFLAQDRDIRELMGARQLYIADVFDVQNNGERSKPFGRVFYTKGKSLLFYAFDLQAQAGYREAKAFQAWGKPDNASGKPISLGIFYMDNEKNRRWVLKSDNPDVLAQINAVFVTVEPRGGSAKPTGKPFLEAYLHSLPPNHP
jgi:Mg2+ and Co2+ transporter CorA